MKSSTYDVERKVLKRLVGAFAGVDNPKRKTDLIIYNAKTISPDLSADELNEIVNDINDLSPIDSYLTDERIEDVMINNTRNVYVYDAEGGLAKIDARFETMEKLGLFIDKIKLYSTNESANGNIIDVHLPSGSRCNIITSPIGYDVTIRNFKKRALSIIDLVNSGELDYQMAARLWFYVDGFRVRPANLLIGGMPASGKTTLLNALFSFFRPESRVVTMEETYELNTETQENCVRLETSDDMPMVELVKNSVRMRPDTIIIGEVRGAEAKDMMTAMNIGKIVLGTIHASTARDVITRLQSKPMDVPMELIPAIDAIVITSQVIENKKPLRKVVQVSEVSGIETKVLLSDLYKYDYKTHQASAILPSVTYRDSMARLIGVAPQDIYEEERVRGSILAAMNKMGVRDIRSINETVRSYYDNPQLTLNKLGLSNMHAVIEV
ncbi:MAG: Flp pilus assembly complex ATPase component TadA [Candidatus Marsarchaeota archaeon]|jgi:flagellar protein FlaI|nr:Flp pilus assembly complex ATPase component TadA [Candidatus Marsarchaeota archaeon]MCL5111383.1 Flp pilus assembly complex ATPase component TadA [Candidatus Marsarchaeota archaeon]